MNLEKKKTVVLYHRPDWWGERYCAIEKPLWRDDVIITRVLFFFFFFFFFFFLVLPSLPWFLF